MTYSADAHKIFHIYDCKTAIRNPWGEGQILQRAVTRAMNNPLQQSREVVMPDVSDVARYQISWPFRRWLSECWRALLGLCETGPEEIYSESTFRCHLSYRTTWWVSLGFGVNAAINPAARCGRVDLLCLMWCSLGFFVRTLFEGKRVIGMTPLWD